MLMLGGWLATIPEVPVKTGLGKIIWEGAQAADALGKRLPELRCGRASVAASESAERGLRGADPGGGRAGAPRPHDREARGPVRRAEAAPGRGLRAHARETDPIADAPTIEILEDIVRRTRRHIAWADEVLERLCDTEERRERRRRRAAELRASSRPAAA